MAKIPPVKGTRDFYPQDMAVRNWILDGWRATAIRNGFVEYDGPIFEYLQLFTEKSGQAIASELFSMTDRGGRDLAIRPEMTPTLARMVNQRINSLPRPIKWFSMPRCCRAERPQRGRLREFFQWNVDIIGAESVLADAECIYTAVDYLRSVGLSADDVVVRVSSRSLLASMLADIGFAPDELEGLYTLLDKRPKMTAEAFGEFAAEQIPDAALRDRLMQLQSAGSLDEVAALATGQTADKTLAQINDLFSTLQTMQIADYCSFDITIVRGLAYYTGCVFEVFDRASRLRAVAAGGRYDNLLAGLGGPAVSGTGFGMGDVVLGILLEEKKLLGASTSQPDYFVIDADTSLFDKALGVACQLRSRGRSAILDYKRSSLGKQLKQASSQNARFAVILGTETETDNSVTLKDLKDGSQTTMSLDEFLSNPR